MVLAASIRRCLPRLQAIDSWVFLTLGNYTEKFKASVDNNVHHPFPTSQYWPGIVAAACAANALDNDGRADALCLPPKARAGNSKGGRRSRKDADSYLLDFNDPNDRAFDLATSRGFSINDAKDYAGATCSYQSLWQRVQRWKEEDQLMKNKEEEAIHCLINFKAVGKENEEGGESATASVTPQTAKKRRGLSPPRRDTTMKAAKKGRVTPPSDLWFPTVDKSPVPNGKRNNEALDVSIELMPEWVDKDKLKEKTGKKSRLSSKLAHESNWNKKAQKDLINARYKRAFKKATEEAWRIQKTRKAGKHGNGLRAIAARYNLEYLNEPYDRRLTRQAIDQCINVRGEHGVSPPKRGAPYKKRHPELTEQLALQAAMNQAAGAGEVTSRMLKNAVTAATVGTEHEGKFKPDYIVRSARKLHPEVFSPVKSLTNEDRRVEWLTYKNINDWTDLVKAELINLGIVYDKPGFMSKLLLMVGTSAYR